MKNLYFEPEIAPDDGVSYCPSACFHPDCALARDLRDLRKAARNVGDWRHAPHCAAAEEYTISGTCDCGLAALRAALEG
jgi:hypothetical protein